MTAREFYLKYINNWPPTPLEKLDGVWLKREDCNTTGSAKSRGVVWQIYSLLERDLHRAVISSSGNAAVAAAHYADLAGIALHVFVSPNIHRVKKAKLESTRAYIHIVSDPITEATKYSEEMNIPYIRQSEDPIAPRGFEFLAVELHRQLTAHKVSLSECSIFFPVSSATMVVGFYRGISKLNLKKMPQIHIVQTQAVNPLASRFDKAFMPQPRSIVGGIVALNTARAQEALTAVEKTEGSGWVPVDGEVEKADEWFKSRGSESSIEASLALAGARKAQNVKFPLRKHLVIMST